ncbi:MAG: hypothetical protein EBR93_05340 [Bacteroidetes bacterium]|nr:hypothetical protein [Bacteroidota bacterium]
MIQFGLIGRYLEFIRNSTKKKPTTGFAAGFDQKHLCSIRPFPPQVFFLGATKTWAKQKKD